MTTINIKFDPQKISEIAGLLNQQNAKITVINDAVSNSSEDLKRIWLGQAAKEYLTKLKTIEERVSLIQSGLEGLSQDLYQASGIYDSGRAKVEQGIESLQTDGVFK